MGLHRKRQRDAADRWIAKLFDAFEEIARMPGIGHWREDLTAYPALFWTVGKYLIIYRTGVPRSVEIVAVTQGVARHPLIPSTPDALRNPVPLHVSERGTVNIQRAHHA